MTEVAIPPTTWARWRTIASATRKSVQTASRSWLAIVTAIVVAAGLGVSDGAWRYAIAAYAPVAGLCAHQLASLMVTRRRFGNEAGEMRAVLVPTLIQRATTAELCNLAAIGSVGIKAWVLRTETSSNAVIVHAEEMPPSDLAIYGAGG